MTTGKILGILLAVLIASVLIYFTVRVVKST